MQVEIDKQVSYTVRIDLTRQEFVNLIKLNSYAEIKDDDDTFIGWNGIGLAVEGEEVLSTKAFITTVLTYISAVEEPEVIKEIWNFFICGEGSCPEVFIENYMDNNRYLIEVTFE